jgi:hypothetical protein
MLKLPGTLFLAGLAVLAMGVTLFFIPTDSKLEWIFAVVLSCTGGMLTVIGASIHVIKE